MCTDMRGTGKVGVAKGGACKVGVAQGGCG